LYLGKRFVDEYFGLFLFVDGMENEALAPPEELDSLPNGGIKNHHHYSKAAQWRQQTRFEA